jgi:uncharacterized membrane protein YwzB
MKKMLYWLSATDLDVLKYCTSRAKNLQETLGAMVLFTGTMAYISGAYAIYTFSESVLACLLGATVYAFGIIQFDRFIVSTSNRLAVVIRIPLAIVIGLAVSLPLETFVLRARIDKQLEEDNRSENKHLYNRKDSTLAAFDAKTKELEGMVNQELEYQQEWSRKMQQEVVGDVMTGLTGRPGEGPAYRAAKVNFDLHTSLLAVARTNLTAHSSQRDALEKKLQDFVDEQKVAQAFDLLARVEALEKIKMKSTEANRIAWLLRILFVLFEIFPAVAKFFLDKNDYFTLLEARDKLNEQQANVQANRGMKEILDHPDTFQGRNDPAESYLTRIKNALMR